MAEIRTSHLLTLKLAVSGMQPIGDTPNGNRRIGLVGGGTFEGPKLSGIVLPGGADWIIGRPDGVTTLDVRIVLQTDDGATIGMTYRGMRHGPPSGDGASQWRPVRRSRRILFPHCCNLRDRRAQIRLAEQDLRHRHRQPAAGRPDLRHFRGALIMATIGFIGLGNMGAPDGGQPGQGRPHRHRLRSEPGRPGGSGQGRRQDAHPARRTRPAAPRSSSPCCRPASTCATSSCTRVA